jgi:mitochondrial fission protein ELM1
VRVFDLNGGDAKFALFHETIQAAGITRSFFGHIESWSFSILDDTARAGAALRAFVLGRRQRA